MPAFDALTAPTAPLPPPSRSEQTMRLLAERRRALEAAIYVLESCDGGSEEEEDALGTLVACQSAHQLALHDAFEASRAETEAIHAAARDANRAMRGEATAPARCPTRDCRGYPLAHHGGFCARCAERVRR